MAGGIGVTVTRAKKDQKVYVFDPDWCMCPGVFLREMIEHAGMSPKLGAGMVSRLSGLPVAMVEGILDGTTEITEDIAHRLATGTQPLAVSAQFWLNAERIYRAGLAAGKTDVSDQYREEGRENLESESNNPSFGRQEG